MDGHLWFFIHILVHYLKKTEPELKLEAPDRQNEEFKNTRYKAPGAGVYPIRYNRELILCNSSTLTPSIFVSATDVKYLQNWIQTMHNGSR